jgi:hypothetical protein
LEVHGYGQSHHKFKTGDWCFEIVAHVNYHISCCLKLTPFTLRLSQTFISPRSSDIPPWRNVLNGVDVYATTAPAHIISQTHTLQSISTRAILHSDLPTHNLPNDARNLVNIAEAFDAFEEKEKKFIEEKLICPSRRYTPAQHHTFYTH